MIVSVSSEMKKRCIEGFIEKQTELSVLFETYKDGYNVGHTDNFIYVKVRSDREMCGSIATVVLKKYNEKDGMTEGDLK